MHKLNFTKKKSTQAKTQPQPDTSINAIFIQGRNRMVLTEPVALRGPDLTMTYIFLGYIFILEKQ